MLPSRTTALLPLALLAFAATGRAADNALVPGELVVEPPTLMCAGFQLFGAGDDNRNATATLEYRETGAKDWKRALPPHRLPDNAKATYKLPLFAGSVLDLRPDTSYECRVTLADPDGVRGDAVKTFTTRTWKEPAIPADAKVRHVYPEGYKGAKEKDYHVTLTAGLTGGRDSGWQNGVAAGAGDLLLLHAGVYKQDRNSYRDLGHNIFTGSYELAPFSGAEGRPLVIKGADDGETVIDGDGCHILFDLSGAKNIHFENLTLRNCTIALQLSDSIDAAPSSNITLKNCRVENVDVGVYGGHPGNRRVFIADSRFVGRQTAVVGSWGDCRSIAAIGLAGRGHVVCHNSSQWFFDFFNSWGFTRGPRPTHADNSAVDIYNNLIRETRDNAIGVFPGINLRALRNTIYNHGDPALDTRNNVGPIYMIRNTVYNARPERAFKTDGGIDGMFAYHNTLTVHPLSFDAYKNSRVQNNLFVGVAKSDKNRAPILDAKDGQNTDLDYNGYRIAPAEFKTEIFRHNGTPHDTLAKFSAASGLEKHGVLVDFDIFVAAPNPYELPRVSPNLVALVDPATIDLRLKPGTPAVDAGVPIPNVNEDFAGRAPDLGAYELGKPLPQIGPRTPAPVRPKTEPKPAPASS